MSFVAVRVRGRVNVSGEIKDTMKMLHLTRVNHCVIVDNNPSIVGMLKKIKDYATWGIPKEKVVAELIRKRGRLWGDKKIDDDYIRKTTPFKNIDELSKAIVEDKFRYSDIPQVKPVFRLSPPKKGYASIKRHFSVGGALGYRGEAINELLMRMI